LDIEISSQEAFRYSRKLVAQLILEFRQQLNWEAWIVAESALYTADNLKLLQGIRWISRVPLTIAEAKRLVDSLSTDELVATQLVGYPILLAPPSRPRTVSG
jgi:hypothetical protein